MSFKKRHKVRKKKQRRLICHTDIKKSKQRRADTKPFLKDRCKVRTTQRRAAQVFFVDCYSIFLNPFTEDFDLPKRICLNGLFLFFFDKVRHFLIKIFNFGDVTKKRFFALSEASKSVFEKCCSTSFSK
jgi:hypothetical protein